MNFAIRKTCGNKGKSFESKFLRIFRGISLLPLRGMTKLLKVRYLF